MTLKEYLHAGGYGALKRLAEDVGTSCGYLSDIASGKRTPSASMAKRIQKSTGNKVTAVELLGLCGTS